jgi:putative inorganic carbon (hco3(-)) transporter
MRPQHIAAPAGPGTKRRGRMPLRSSVATSTTLLGLRFRDSWRYFASQGLAFQAMCLYLVIEYVRPQQIFSLILGAPLGQIALGTAVVAYALSGERMGLKGAGTWLLLLFTGVIIASSFTAFSPEESMREMRNWFSWVIIFMLIVNVVNTEQRLVFFTLVWLLCNYYMSQGGAKQFALRGFSFTDYGIVGAPGWFQNSGEFGIAMCMLFSVSWHFYVAARPHLTKWRKVLVLGMPVTALLGILGSSSRGAVVGFAAFLAYTFLRSKRRVRTFATLVVLSAAAWALLPPEQKARFDTAGEDRTSISRQVYWTNGLRMAQEHPVLGIGYNNWLAYYRARYSDAKSEFGIQLSHNIFIQCMAELGYTGLLVFISMILATLVINYQTRKTASARAGPNDFSVQLAYGLDGAMLTYVVAGYFVTVLYYPFFWINLALTVALSAIVQQKGKAVVRRRGTRLQQAMHGAPLQPADAVHAQ